MVQSNNPCCMKTKQVIHCGRFMSAVFYEKGVIMSILTLNNITQQFGDKILYEGVDLQLNAGEHLGLIGQNGAGKSTLIKIITGEILPDDGQIHWQKIFTKVTSINMWKSMKH